MEKTRMHVHSNWHDACEKRPQVVKSDLYLWKVTYTCEKWLYVKSDQPTRVLAPSYAHGIYIYIYNVIYIMDKIHEALRIVSLAHRIYILPVHSHVDSPLRCAEISGVREYT